MSKILEQLKQAEAQRERIVAERQQLEDEANAALAAREREELARRAAATAPAADPVALAKAESEALAASRVRQAEAAAREKAEAAGAQPPRQDRRVLAGAAVAIAVALAAVFWGILFVPQKDAAKEPGVAASAPQVLQAETRGGSLRLKLDQDTDAFAARVREKERQ